MNSTWVVLLGSCPPGSGSIFLAGSITEEWASFSLPYWHTWSIPAITSTCQRRFEVYLGCAIIGPTSLSRKTCIPKCHGSLLLQIASAFTDSRRHVLVDSTNDVRRDRSFHSLDSRHEVAGHNHATERLLPMIELRMRLDSSWRDFIQKPPITLWSSNQPVLTSSEHISSRSVYLMTSISIQ